MQHRAECHRQRERAVGRERSQRRTRPVPLSTERVCQFCTRAEWSTVQDYGTRVLTSASMGRSISPIGSALLISRNSARICGATKAEPSKRA